MPIPAARILVVEDTQTLLYLYSRILRDGGYAVSEATTLAQARTLLVAVKPHIVLLDRVLPDGDGSQLLQWIKETPEYEDTYVVILSAVKTSEDDRVSGLEAGADDYIVKPVSKRELLARMHVATRLKAAQLALQESEAKHRTLAENSPDLILRLDRSGRPTYVNSRSQDLLGFSPEQILSATTGNLSLAPEQAARWQQACHRVADQGTAERFEFSMLLRGALHYFDVHLVPEFGADNQLQSMLAVVRDYTDRVESERAIARLAAVIEQTQDSVFITSTQGDLLFVNAACANLLGFTPADIGRNLRDLCQTFPSLAESHAQVCTGRANWSGVTRIKRVDDTLCEVEAAMFVIADHMTEKLSEIVPTVGPMLPAASADAVVTMLRDVSERRRAEREREVILAMASSLRKATSREEVINNMLVQIMTMLEVGSVAVTTLDPVCGEPVLEQALGTQDHMTGSHRANPIRLTQEVLDRTSPVIYEELTRPSAEYPQGYTGSLRTLLGVPMKLPNRSIGVLWVADEHRLDDHVVSVMLAVADMAANTLHRVALFEELEQYAASLELRVEERTRELAEANQQLRELDRLKSKFVSNVSHELRNPISNLKLYMSLLQRGRPEKRTHYEAMLETSVQRLGQLVEDILNLSRLEIAHYQPKELEPTDLNAVIQQIIALHAPQAESAGLNLSFEADATAPLIDGDYNQLSQLVTNLIVNSLHYTRQGGIHVQTQAPNGREAVLITVEDTGVGILPDDLPHVFERFYRGNHRQPHDIPGTGLGLAIVKEIVDIHHGEIALESRPDEGTRVQIKLPVRQQAAKPGPYLS
jgi:PAS domain S-box-containing protein